MYLPNEIVNEIFLRLPVKSILRCRCVCKSWYKYLKHDDFVKKQLIHSFEKNNSKVVLTCPVTYPAIFSIDYDQSSSLFSSSEKVFEMVDSAFKGRYVQILGSCNGLFFITICQGRVTALWNPATKEYKIIGTPNIEPAGFKNPRRSPRIYRWIQKYGFGYDYKTNDYKLVSIVSPYSKNIAEVEVYTLGSNSWKRLEYIPYKITGGPPGVFVNGALHWLANPCPVGSENKFSQVLLSFNMAEEVFSEVPQLEIFDDNMKFEHRRLDAVEGYLSMLCSHSNVGFEVWVMSEYGVRDSWTKRYTISVDVIPSFLYLRRIHTLKNGEMLLEIKSYDYVEYAALVFYDPKHDKTRLVDIDLGKSSLGRRTIFYTGSYVESLVSLHSGTYFGGGQEESDLSEALGDWDDWWE